MPGAGYPRLSAADDSFIAAGAQPAGTRHLAPVRSDDQLRIEVTFDRITESSIHVRYAATVDDVPVAEAGSRYVCVGMQSGKRASLPEAIRTA